MSRLSLTFACCRYDRMEAIREGAVPIEGIDLNCITLRSGREVFDRMVGGREFDVAELSASEFISLMGRGDCPFVALPVFPSRVFRHGYIFVNTRAGIRAPKDLEGKRIGLPLYTQTAAIWARGHLVHQFGVNLDAVRWVQGAVEKAGTHGRPHAPCSEHDARTSPSELPGGRRADAGAGTGHDRDFAEQRALCPLLAQHLRMHLLCGVADGGQAPRPPAIALPT